MVSQLLTVRDGLSTVSHLCLNSPNYVSTCVSTSTVSLLSLHCLYCLSTVSLLSLLSLHCLSTVSLLSLYCLSSVPLLCLIWCHGDVTVMSWWCHGDVMVMSWWCHDDVRLSWVTSEVFSRLFCKSMTDRRTDRQDRQTSQLLKPSIRRQKF